MAKQIRSMAELVKDIQRRIDSGDKTIMKELKASSGQTMEQITKRDLGVAASALKEFLQNWIRDYYSSFTPAKYIRTYAFINSIDVKVFNKSGVNQAVVYFNDNDVIRDSFMNNQPRGYLPSLLSNGWTVKKPVSFKDVYHVGYYDGFHFMELAFEQVKRDPRFKNIEIIMHNDPQEDIPWAKL